MKGAREHGVGGFSGVKRRYENATKTSGEERDNEERDTHEVTGCITGDDRCF